MNPNESLESLVNAERQEELSTGERERGWKRLQAAVRSGTRPMPVIAAPLSLGAVLFTTKAAAVLAFAGAGTALAAATWSYRVELGIVPVSQEPDTQVSAPTSIRHKGNGSSPPAADRAVDDVRPTPSSSESPSPPPPSPKTSWSESRRSLDDELDLLGRATAELDSGRPNAARALLRRHATEYPKSMLALERKTLWILVECRFRPGPESRALAERFLSRYPKSLHRDRLERACSLNAQDTGKPVPAADAASVPAPPGAVFPDLENR